MKKVILDIPPPNEDLTSVSSCNEEFYYGIDNKAKKGFITRREFSNDCFICMCFSELTNGNHWGGFKSNNLWDVVRNLLKASFVVYEFKSYQELCRWAAAEE